MPTSHDLRQDARLDKLDTQVANLRKRINANVRKMKEISDKINRLTPQSGQSPTAASSRPSRRKSAPRGAKK